MATRAVLKNIEAGLEAKCPRDGGGCGQEVKFLARIPSRFRRRVVANIYWFEEWNRTETWHLLCYFRAGMPYGRPAELKDEDLAVLENVFGHQSDPWKLTPDELMEIVIAHYRAMNANLNIATVQ